MIESKSGNEGRFSLRPMLLNAFDMACPGHIQQGMWCHARDRSADYAKLEHCSELARLLKRGLFDGLFRADVLGVYDVYGGGPEAALRGAVQVPMLDPAGGYRGVLRLVRRCRA